MEAMNSSAQSTGDIAVAGGAHAVESTGDVRVDEQMRALNTIEDLPVAEHVEVFEGVHRALGDILNIIDTDGQTLESGAAGEENAAGTSDDRRG